MITAGLDIGSGAVKALVRDDDSGEILAHAMSRIRRRDLRAVVDEVFGRVVQDAGVDRLEYVATTGEGEDVEFASGHFYGMTTHGRGALELEPEARAVLDVGALHARAICIDERGKVLRYKMTSQCASGSGQFLENIARYLGVPLSEVGRLSMSAQEPEKVSSICAVLAETDVINMVSRGIATEDILRGIHDSMAGRFARLLRSLGVEGVVFVSGGLAQDEGLLASIGAALEKSEGSSKRRPSGPIRLVSHPLSQHAGALGAAIWGAFRARQLGDEAPEPWLRTPRRTSRAGSEARIG